MRPGRALLIGWSGLSLFFLLVPFLFVVLASLGPDPVVVFPPRGLTLKWYGAIQPAYARSFLFSLALAAISASIAIALAIPTSLALIRSRPAGRDMVQALVRAPLQVPQLAIGVAFLQFYGLVYDWAGFDPAGSLPGLVLAHFCFTFPYAVSAIATALTRSNPRLEEAAYSLGASRWSALRRVILPEIKQAIVAAFFFSFITSFENVPVSLFLVGSGTTTLPLMIFEDVQFAFGPTIMAVSTLVVILSTLLILLVQRFAGLDPDTGTTT